MLFEKQKWILFSMNSLHTNKKSKKEAWTRVFRICFVSSSWEDCSFWGSAPFGVAGAARRSICSGRVAFVACPSVGVRVLSFYSAYPHFLHLPLPVNLLQIRDNLPVPLFRSRVLPSLSAKKGFDDCRCRNLWGVAYDMKFVSGTERIVFLLSVSQRSQHWTRLCCHHKNTQKNEDKTSTNHTEKSKTYRMSQTF